MTCPNGYANLKHQRTALGNMAMSQPSAPHESTETGMSVPLYSLRACDSAILRERRAVSFSKQAGPAV